MPWVYQAIQSRAPTVGPAHHHRHHRPHGLSPQPHLQQYQYHPRHQGYDYHRPCRYNSRQQVQNCSKFHMWRRHHGFRLDSPKTTNIIAALAAGASFAGALATVFVALL
ncbi:hypothetical protein ABBQ38_012473 [Trebouxia sp. C0009 RCD-2024]